MSSEGRSRTGVQSSRSPASVVRELRAILGLAGPIIATHMGTMLLSAVDSMMLGRVSGLALAAGALGASVAFGVAIFAMGALMALDPLVAQAYGAGEHRRAGHHLLRGVVLALALSVPLSLLMWNARPILDLLRQRAEVAELSSQYLRAMVPGVPAFLLTTALRQFLQALGRPQPALWAIVVTNVVNVVANYALIFGHWGCPRLEVTGSGLATSLARWFTLVALVWMTRGILRRYVGSWSRAAVDWASVRHLLGLGLPIAAQSTLEVWFFMAVALMMGALGTSELAGHQIALNLVSLFYMIPLGLGAAAAARVGQAIGAGDHERARLSAAVNLAFVVCVMLVAASVFLSAPGRLARLYTADVGVIAVAAHLLPVAAAFQVFDGIQVVASGVLRGTADVRVPATIALIGYWLLGLPFGYWLAFERGAGPRGTWWGLTAGLAAVALPLLVRCVMRFRGELVAVEDGAPSG